MHFDDAIRMDFENLPENPTRGTKVVHTSTGKVYEWNGNIWERIGDTTIQRQRGVKLPKYLAVDVPKSKNRLAGVVEEWIVK